MDWGYFAVFSIYLLAATIVILKIPLYLQRPMALSPVAIFILINAYAFSTPGLEWFIPFLFLKLLVSHLVHEEPYRPAK